MAKSDQVLILEPSAELKFCGPFNDVVTSELKLSNPTDKRVSFKVKTTAPRRYCVRPNSGTVEPNKSVTVAVMLQPFEYDPNEKNKHKFMVQSLYAPDGEVNLDSLFKHASQTDFMDSKLRCVFKLPEDAQTTQNNVTVPAPQAQKEAPKSSPKPSANLESDLQKASEEIKGLRDEASTLLKENIHLKEQVLRMRNSPAASGEGKVKSENPLKILSPPTMRKETPITQYLLVFAFLLFGYIMGKFIL